MALTTVPASLSATALTLTTAAQPNITSVGTLTGLTVSGNIAGTLTTAAQTNITSVGTLSALSVGNITSTGNITTSGNLLINAASGNPYVSIKTAGTGNNPYVEYRAGNNIVFDNMLVASATTDYWRVGYGASGTVTSEYLAVTSGGNVGIGTTSPDEILHVKGDGARIYVDSTDYNLFSIGRRGSSGADLDKAYLRMKNAGTNTIVLDTAGDSYFNGGKLLHGTTTIPTGVLLGNQFVSSSATGSEIIAFREDTSVAVGDKTGAFLLGNSDTDGAEDHFVGMYGKVSSTNGSQNLHFVAGRSGYEGDTPDMTIKSGGNVGIGEASPDALLHLDSGTSTDILRFGDSGRWGFQRQNSDSRYVSFSRGMQSSASPVLTVDGDNGNVAIGTTSPSAQLTITDENAGQAVIHARNFATSATGSFVNQHAYEFRAATSTTTHGMLVALHENSSTRRSLEVADSTGIFATFVQGKLGIGRNNPSARLHLQSTGSATYSGSSAGSNIGLYLTNAESGAAGRTIGIGMTCESNTEIYLNAVTGANNNGGDFVIASRNAGTRAEKMRVHAAGHVTRPLNASFQVRMSNSSGVNGGNGPVVLNYSGSTFHNVGSHFNTSNGRFTAPVTGVYVFHANLRVDGFTGNYSYLTLQHFSSTGTQQASKGRDLQHGNSANYINHNISQNVYLLANEYVRLVYENNGDSSVNLDSDSYFSGYLLG